MVMVSITFAVLNRGIQAYLLPTGLPHAHPRISNILGHGSKLMAISLFGALACALAEALVWPEAQAMASSPRPQAMAMAPGLEAMALALVPSL